MPGQVPGLPAADDRYEPGTGWRSIGWVDAVTALAPSIQRIHDDKLPTLLDDGWRQLAPYLPARPDGAETAH